MNIKKIVIEKVEIIVREKIISTILVIKIIRTREEEEKGNDQEEEIFMKHVSIVVKDIELLSFDEGCSP